jgi:alpha-glucosidase
MSFDPDVLRGIHHDGSPLFVSSLSPRIGDDVTIRLRVPCTLSPEPVGIRSAPDGEQQVTPMRKAYDDKISSWWEGTLRISQPFNSYRFFIILEGKVLWYNASGVTGAMPPDLHDFRIPAGDLHPSWLDNAVFYQIFPDRFSKGGRTSPEDHAAYDGYTRIEREWGEAPLAHELAGNMDFFGGNLRGIMERLDYIGELGVTALYLNPIFTSPSNHKYDCIDYFSIDPSLGGNEDLQALAEALREKGMKIILDIAPNHCGFLHPWFQEAVRDLNGPTAEFFTFYGGPQEYEMWKGVKTLPKLNYRSMRLRGVMFRDSDSVVRTWMRPPYSIDGWRVDVANMLARQGETQLGHEVGRELREVVKAENGQAYLMGEHFFDGSSHLQGDELDASMNYQGFAFPFWNWLAPQELWWMKNFQDLKIRRMSTRDLIESWKSSLAIIPWASARRQFNFLGNHDTPRILHILEGNRRLALLAAAVLFCFPGVPSIYYGDEVGLQGRRDPGCRECMPWKREAWNHELLGMYRRLAALRRSSPALAHGGFEVLHVEEEVFAFKRESFEESLILIVNRSPLTRNGLAIEAALHGIAENRLFISFEDESPFRVKEGKLVIPTLAGESFVILRSALR